MLRSISELFYGQLIYTKKIDTKIFEEEYHFKKHQKVFVMSVHSGCMRRVISFLQYLNQDFSLFEYF